MRRRWRWKTKRRKGEYHSVGHTVYTRRQRQRGENSVIMLVILFSLKTMELLRKLVATPIESDSIGFNENSVFANILMSLANPSYRDSKINSPGQKFTWLDI